MNSNIKYISTRGIGDPKSFKDVLLSGTAPDGGLYVPDVWPSIDAQWLGRLSGLSYEGLASQIIQPFVGNDIPGADFQKIVSSVYGMEQGRFEHSAITPLRQIGPNVWILELFHGPTYSFKDIALQLLGKLFDYVLKKNNKRITIVGATSGDTGSAAIEGCKHKENIDVVILHPYERTSEIQRRQMTTVHAHNVHNIAVKGTFDDWQNMVKSIFADPDIRERHNLTSINSINWMRIAAQMVYYAASSLALGSPRRPVSFVVPTGNFGNVYAAYCIRQLGLPVDQLVIANNNNRCLTYFLQSGQMKRGSVTPTISPSMDIQVPSNFERYLFEVLKRDHRMTAKLMNDLKVRRSFMMDDSRMQQIRKDFRAQSVSDEETSDMMRICYETTGILVDPHTAVGLAAAQEVHNDPAIPLICLACAHPAKFPLTVQKATGKKPEFPERLKEVMTMQENYQTMEPNARTLKTFISKLK